jgi:hypothetical protein
VKKRTGTRSNFDPSGIDSLTYNDYSGSRKVSQVGHKLEPMPISGGFSTNATSARGVGAGVSLAIFNNSGSVVAVTTGDSTVASQAVGVVQGSTPATLSPFVGIPCKPNDWTYINTYDHSHIIASSVNALVYIVKDDTKV